MSNRQVKFYDVKPPTKWRAGFTGTGENQKEFFMLCCKCGEEKPIAGFSAYETKDGSPPTFFDVALIRIEGSPMVKPAMYCAECMATLPRVEPTPDEKEEALRAEVFDQNVSDLEYAKRRMRAHGIA